jgi:oligoribonuclease NrnB/cAMP/cGMP phosphodiesterase (DHH superfamily)
MLPTVIIHHANCPDGFGSAWLMNQAIAGQTKIIAASYGDPLPDEVDGADVIIVDFCYPSNELDELTRRANKCLILDHHQTSFGYLEDSFFTLYHSVEAMGSATPSFAAVLDIEHSGVGLVQEFTGNHVPFLANVEDRDLWRFDLPGTADVFAVVTSYPYTLDAWDYLESMHLDDMKEQGAAINRYRDQLIEAAVKNARRVELPTGHVVWASPCPYAIGSDVAGELAKRTPDTFAAYYVDSPGKVRFGLRSGPDGADVAAIAEKMGGGGHKHASGFETTYGWSADA